MASTRAVIFTAPGKAEVLPIEVPSPGPGQVLVEVQASAVSVGTEMRVFKGIQEPSQSFPQCPGYANAGIVIEAGPGVENLLGRRVVGGGSSASSVPMMWGGQMGLTLLPADIALPMPDGVSLEQGALVRLGAIAYRGFSVAQPKPDDKVLLVGLGVIGQMAARIYRAHGLEAVAVDLSPARVEAAKTDGVDARVISTLMDAKGVFPEGPDLIVDSTGSERVVKEGYALARMFPWDDEDHRCTRYVIQGSYPGEFSIPYQEAFERQLIYLIPRDNQPKDRRAFLSLLAEGKVKVEGVIKRFPVEEAPTVYSRCLQGDPDLIAPVLLWK